MISTLFLSLYLKTTIPVYAIACEAELWIVNFLRLDHPTCFANAHAETDKHSSYSSINHFQKNTMEK